VTQCYSASALTLCVSGGDEFGKTDAEVQRKAASRLERGAVRAPKVKEETDGALLGAAWD
jgi:hypothetical protein